MGNSKTRGRLASFPKTSPHFAHGAKDEFVHCFRFSLAGIGVEVHPLSIWTKHEHVRSRHRIVRPNARLRDQKRSGLVAGAEIQEFPRRGNRL